MLSFALLNVAAVSHSALPLFKAIDSPIDGAFIFPFRTLLPILLLENRL